MGGIWWCVPDTVAHGRRNAALLRDANRGQQFEHALARCWSRDPDEWPILDWRPAEGEREPVRGKDER